MTSSDGDIVRTMAIKFVHVLKRIEIINRDIQELHNIMDAMAQDRQYSDAIKISLESQVNVLLNERVKLMELKIENPPPQFEKQPETHEQALKMSPQYDFEQFNNNSQGSSRNFARNYVVSEVNPAKQTSKLNVTENEEKIGKAPLSAMTRSDILKDLPPLEY